MKDLIMYLRDQNLRLKIICVVLFIIVLALATWIWFDSRIEVVNHEIEKLQTF